MAQKRRSRTVQESGGDREDIDIQQRAGGISPKEEEHGSFAEFPLCLSRACLGKCPGFGSYKEGSKNTVVLPAPHL